VRKSSRGTCLGQQREAIASVFPEIMVRVWIRRVVREHEPLCPGTAPFTQVMVRLSSRAIDWRKETHAHHHQEGAERRAEEYRLPPNPTEGPVAALCEMSDFAPMKCHQRPR